MGSRGEEKRMSRIVQVVTTLLLVFVLNCCRAVARGPTFDGSAANGFVLLPFIKAYFLIFA
ncbi:hypothetical protein BEN47_05655 [Hymenobacter lapidarius]|uniref:Uncharacterized protein n=1 Tax=Hymenobacter lapidarius TaxID=1908237 RepID=A0A1G1SS28_9BACT|nr:hypothetical protein BEN47_05655 [Hymenobacter lapidarius]